ncbi:unnamed protein product [Mytilus coruscus]|uniref:Integrase catalytic domain-containing protein n=1 Tax=Mytilus coruscus TaxID=42192 RepID=A0A6J8DGS6_MYTCO|nr:unnamed protein product [Mytilus coruscus]
MKDETGPVDIKLTEGVILLNGVTIPCIQIGKPEFIRKVRAADNFTIPPQSEILIDVFVDKTENDSISPPQDYLIEPSSHFIKNHPVMMASSFVNLCHDVTNKVRLINPFDQEVQINQDTVVGLAEKVKFSSENTKDSTNFDSVRRIQFESNPVTWQTNEGIIRNITKKGTTDGGKSGVVPPHLINLFTEASEGRSEKEQEAIANLLHKYATAFSAHETDLGLTNLTGHSIDTGDARPIKQAPRRVPLAFDEEERKIITQMLDQGVIENSSSPWASQLLLIRKKNGKIRPAVDYRKINSKTVCDVYPLPRIQDCLDVVSGAYLFSVFDLISGFHQIPVKLEDRPKTAFTTNLKEPKGRVARWLEILSPFNFSVEYRPGIKHGNADAMSRCHNPRECDCSQVDNLINVAPWVEVFPVKDQTAVVCAQLILNEVICRFGSPFAIHSDQVRAYKSQIFQELCKILEIRKSRTSPRNPKCNGQTERFNRCIISLIKSYLRGEQTNWDMNLGCLAGAYRASPNESTCLTPNILMLGREVRLPYELIHKGHPLDTNEADTCTSWGNHALKIKERMQGAHCVARKHLEVNCKRRKDYYNNKTNLYEYKVSDKVWYRNEIKREDFPHYEVLPAMDSQRHWASKVRTRPLATPVRAAALPATHPYQTQAPVRAVALPATRPNQTQAPVRASALPATHHIQTKAPVRAATHPYPTYSSYHVTNARPQPSLQSRLGPPVYMNATSLHHLTTPVSPAVPSSLIDIPTTAVRPAANQVMPLESSSASPMDDLYDLFMPDVTMTSTTDHSTTISSVISHYLPLETPSVSTSISPVTSVNHYSTVPVTTTMKFPEPSKRPKNTNVNFVES